MVQCPEISIITPSLNQGEFIEDAILSVMEQDYPNFEHIVIDACSTDNTPEVLRKYPHLIWVSEPDHGQSDAINKGFQMATGDIVAWLNADDYYLPRVFQKIMRFWEGHPEADVVYGDCCFVDIDGRFLRRKLEPGFDLGMLIYYDCYIPSTATFFRRSVIDERLLLDTKYHNCMDMEYFVRLATQKKRFSHIPVCLACFRWHEGNISTLYVERRRKERRRVQQKYGFHMRFGSRDVFLYGMEKAYRLKHIACKILMNAYIRERIPFPSEPPSSKRPEPLEDRNDSFS